MFIGYGTWKWIDTHARTGQSPVCATRSIARSRCRPMRKVNGMPATSRDIGARHAGEIEYVFGTLDSRKGVPWEPIDRTLSDAMTSYWTARGWRSVVRAAVAGLQVRRRRGRCCTSMKRFARRRGGRRCTLRGARCPWRGRGRIRNTSTPNFQLPNPNSQGSRSNASHVGSWQLEGGRDPVL